MQFNPRKWRQNEAEAISGVKLIATDLGVPNDFPA